MAAEKNFENRVKKYLDEYGCWWLKYWGGAAYTKSGIPDLLVSSDGCLDRKSTRLNSSHRCTSRMPSSA